MEKQSTGICQVCGTGLAGRIDKRFCSDQCRAQLHNVKRKSDAGERMIWTLTGFYARTAAF